MHMTPQTGMAVFVSIATYFNLRNCLKLRRDRCVAGLCPWTIAFYTGANFYNLFFWASLGQWLAVIPGVPMAGFNALWVAMAFYYRRRRRPGPQPA